LIFRSSPQQIFDAYDHYDVRTSLKNPVPPKSYVGYLQDQTVIKKIGAQGEHQEL
jgi:hypothetical protein